MRKQTKLVAVLSTAALLAIGASMTSFAATGWAEEDGTWVYYNREGERATDQWKKSGSNWYYLNSDGEMATDELIDDGDNYFYVDANGVMASNQWVAIENEDAGQDNEPDNYWYYFQSNGKALTNGNNSNVSLKTINGKKYAFDSEGKMLYGWVDKTDANRIDNTNGDAFLTGDYYFGSEDDGAMTVGWLQTDITYNDSTSGVLADYVAPVFNDDEDQTRWFYFQTSGKKVKADTGKEEKDKTINGKKYSFDKNGAMTAEWSLDYDKAVATDTNGNNILGQVATPGVSAAPAYTRQWRYFNSVDDGARISKGWFKVVAAEKLDTTRYNDDDDAWYYADGNGKLYAGEFKTIKGKKYAFRADGRMLDGLKLVKDDSTGWDVQGDDGNYNFETEENFDQNAFTAEKAGYRFYYFGDSSDGSMKTGTATVDIDGDKFNFYFETAGSKKGAGKSAEKDKKFYEGGKLVKAGKDEKYQVVETLSGTYNNTQITGYDKYSDAKDFILNNGRNAGIGGGTSNITVGSNIAGNQTQAEALIASAKINKKWSDLSELYAVTGTDIGKFSLVNTSGKKMTGTSKYKDGNDYNYVIQNGNIVAIYVEN